MKTFHKFIGLAAIFLTLASIGCADSAGGSWQRQKHMTFNAMAPLLVGDPDHPDSPKDQAAWKQFRDELTRLRELGVYAVSTDVWWGMVQKGGENSFDWKYYDKVSDAIISAGLKWVAVLSFHKCGGNVGDDVNVPLPDWIWTKYVQAGRIKDKDTLKFKSEQGNYSEEYVSVWGTSLALEDYRRFMSEFQKHFAPKAGQIAEINISLGPSGELRYPSYGPHDNGTGFPTRGGLQSYSDLAVESFRRYALHKYGSLEAVNKAWNTGLANENEIQPPRSYLYTGVYASVFFKNGEHLSAYGMDFFDWYSDSLLNHGRAMLFAAIEVFGQPGAPFNGIDIGGKIAGIHWRAAGDREAELAAGLIRTRDSARWNSDSTVHGYLPILEAFHNAARHPSAPRIVLHFTCLEKDDLEVENGLVVKSSAKSLVLWVGNGTTELGVPIKGENALPVGDQHGWDNINHAMFDETYEGVTILRMDDILKDKTAVENMRKMIQRSKSPQWSTVP